MIGISGIQRRTTDRSLHRHRPESENRPFRWSEKRATSIQDRKKCYVGKDVVKRTARICTGR